MISAKQQIILLIANSAKSMINFRWVFMQELLKLGYQVVLVVPPDDEAFIKLKTLNLELIPLKISRIGMNPFLEAICWWKIYQIIKRYKPNWCMFYTIKPNIYGSIAACLTRVKYFAMITGLGYVFTNDNPTWKQKVLSNIVKKIYKIALKRSAKVFFLNPDDYNYFLTNDIISKEMACLINGEGVDVDHFSYSEVNLKQPITFLFLARLLQDKGIYEFINAARLIKQQYPEVQFKVAGAIDSNPSSITSDELNNWIKEKIIDYLGYLADVRDALKNSSVLVLPSYYREGLPISILEAMSIGRAIITTDAPGCRETVINETNGYLVPKKNAELLAKAMKNFIIHPENVAKMGIASRQIVEDKFDVAKINASIFKAMELYTQNEI